MNELGPEAREILEAGRAGDEPTAADRHRLRASVMRAIAAGGASTLASSLATETSAAGLKAGAISIWKVAAGITFAAAITGGVASRFAGETPHVPSNAPTVIATVNAAPAPPRASASAESSAPPPTAEPSVSAAPPAPTVAPVAPRPRASSTASARSEAPAAPPPPPEDTLAAETADLREAHRAMQSGDPARALAVLDRQENKGSALREEREAARVLALCQAGRVEEGRAAAARFLQASPRSPLADRVRGACAPREETR
jgi:hypothetical protein